MSKAYTMRVELLIEGDRDLIRASARSIGRTWWAQRDRVEKTQDDIREEISGALSQPQLSNLQNGIPVGKNVSDAGIEAAFRAVGLTSDIAGVSELVAFVIWWRDYGWI